MYIEFIEDVTALVKELKDNIRDEHLAFEDDDAPGIQLTVAVDDKNDIINCDYAWQTGDNSFTGDAYYKQHWAVTGIYRDTDVALTAQDLLGQLFNLIQ